MAEVTPQERTRIMTRAAIVYAMSLTIFGFIADTPLNVVQGLFNIISQPDILITDYFGIGGFGAPFVNSGILTLIFILMLKKMQVSFSGATLAALFTISGFAVFGKNLFNVWLIVLGVYIYARVQKEKFTRYIYVALFGTALGPLVSEVLFATSFSFPVRLILAVVVGVVAGYILPPLSTHMLRFHGGFDLYNVGFTAGIIGTVFISVFKSYGFISTPRLIWTTEYSISLSVFFGLMFLVMLGYGYYLNNRSFKGLKAIYEYSGRMVTDFVILEGFGPTLINMGINGLVAIAYIHLAGGVLNGPTLAGVLTIVGFSAFGKHLRNILPIFLGIFIGSLTKIWALNDPAILLAALFGTGLAPVAGEYGWLYGMLAAYLHSSVVLNVGVLHGGVNLYNNGFAAGIVAAFIVPIIDALRKDED